MGEKPIVISEFGGYAYRCEGHLFSDKNYGYTTYRSSEEFAKAVERLYTDEVIPMVERGVSALVYTQVSDVEDETNGFMTYDRKVLKVDRESFYEVSKKLFYAFDESNK